MALTQYGMKPEPGDLIEIFRGVCQHWAVYVGNGFVVHLVPWSEYAGAGCSSSMTSLDCKTALVKKEQLWDVVGADQWKINNSLDHCYRPRPTHVIVKEACELVGRELPYSVISHNCEHFVNELRYGKSLSWQVLKVTALFAVFGVFGIVALAGAKSGSSSKKNKKKQ